jgi:predicted AAA+ superfamily ATPase
MNKRTIQLAIQEAIDNKIILLSGPRQVGKTFLSKNLEEPFQYLNFDRSEDKLLILEKKWI